MEEKKQRNRIAYKLLRENNKLLQENNKILKKMNRARVLGFWSKIIFYALIIGIPFFIYKYYLEDSFHSLINAYTDLQAEVAEIKELKDKLPF
jgi:hypothetical protein